MTEIKDIEKSKDSGEMSKNVIMAGIGLMTAAGLLFADKHWGKRQWPSAESRLVGLDVHVQEAALTFPGLGSLDGENQARHAQLILGAGTGAHWHYSSEGISTGELAAVLRNQASNLRLVHLNGHSMGGPLSLETIREAKIPGLKLGRVVLHCSPFDIKDARNNHAASVVRKFNVHGGPGTKFGVMYIKNRLLDGKTRAEAFKQACHHAKNGCSPRLWISQINTLHGFDLQAHMSEYQALVGPQTEFIYCMPEDSSRDKTVKTEQASQRYSDFCNALGVPYRVVRVPDMGHAEVGKAYEHLGLLAEDAFRIVRPTATV